MIFRDAADFCEARLNVQTAKTGKMQFFAGRVWPRAFWFYLGAIFLCVQSLGAVFWWLALVFAPQIRPLFRPANAPDAVLLAFWLPDLVLFLGAALWSAFWLLKNPARAKIPLALHVGGASYAALFCVAQTLLTGQAKWATIFMVPSMILGAALLWLVCRTDSDNSRETA